jgi:hypothetical protein
MRILINTATRLTDDTATAMENFEDRLPDALDKVADLASKQVNTTFTSLSGACFIYI